MYSDEEPGPIPYILALRKRLDAGGLQHVTIIAPDGGGGGMDEIAREIPALEIYDPTEFSAEDLLAWAETCEEAARGVEGVTNSEGAGASQSHSMIALAASNGFRGAYRTSRFTVGASVIAGEGLNMVRGHEYTSKRFVADMDDLARIGRIAGERTVARLNPRRPKTARVPVVFDRRVSRMLVAAIASAVMAVAMAVTAVATAVTTSQRRKKNRN